MTKSQSELILQGKLSASQDFYAKITPLSGRILIATNGCNQWIVFLQTTKSFNWAEGPWEEPLGGTNEVIEERAEPIIGRNPIIGLQNLAWRHPFHVFRLGCSDQSESKFGVSDM